jgi:hypothetical protein
VKLQGNVKLLSDIFSDVKAFEMKLKLLHINKQNLDHFPFCKIALESFIEQSEWLILKNKLVSNIQQLRNEFSSRFVDLYTSSNEILLLKNSFAIDINEVPAQMQMKLIELKSNNYERCFFRRKSTKILCRSHYFKSPHHQDFRKKMIRAFVSTYICEQAFSIMNYRKNKYCSRLTNEHLYALLRISSYSFEADIHKLAGDIQPQKSHYADFKMHFIKV